MLCCRGTWLLAKLRKLAIASKEKRNRMCGANKYEWEDTIRAENLPEHRMAVFARMRTEYGQI